MRGGAVRTAPPPAGAPVSRPAAAPPTERLRVDPIACRGIGVCALTAPDLVELDRWGFPAPVDGPLTSAEREQAARAVRACPRQALWLAPPAHR